ncbi:ras-related protein rab-13 [Anaeramoeba ignava]|uniref:Ras-related protein rab-13 n=1 Tax=Anaeramoeba ignava TaxID=1746090 RepID=A0A9Q0LJR5_ANAIG|nr:ras-related protein rab-13 [Anaeramoeba ignava]
MKKVKIVFAGDTGVGKTCLMNLIVGEKFSRSQIQTMGVEVRFLTKNIEEKEVNFEMWDTAGQERYDSLTKQYFRDAHGIILVYDITREDSVERAKKLYLKIKDEIVNDFAIVLVGNKIDLENKRIIQFSQGENLAKSWNCSFFETSAKIGTNVKEAFEKIFEQGFLKWNSKKEYHEIILTEKFEKSSCC